MGKAVKTDIEYKEILEKSLSAIQYLRIHGFSTYMESEGIVNRIMMFKDKNEMREELRTIGSKGRHVFTTTFVRFGFRNGYIGPVKTMLLQDVTLDSKIVSDHLWFDLTKGFSDADLSPGDVVEFCARVSAYEKGYKGHKDDVLNRPIERDYRLSRPTKIKKIGKKLILKDEGK